jgi:hypothetical protein
MKYETPKLTVLTFAINAVQALTIKHPFGVLETASDQFNEAVSTYLDWED